jgi:hypothetical protein
VLDPRAKFSLEDRKAQFDLAMKIYHTIEHMTYAVEAIEGVRNAGNERAAKLTEKDPLRKQLQDLAAKCDELRGKIVATKEGGMITGEERIRELLGQLYGTVNGYEGRPAEYQAARADSLAHELEDVIADFQKLTQKELPGINAGLKKKKAEAISVLTEGDWQKKRAAEGGSGSAAGMFAREGLVREMD